jgi:polysaccharide export outer membrane protein
MVAVRLVLLLAVLALGANGIAAQETGPAAPLTAPPPVPQPTSSAVAATDPVPPSAALILPGDTLEITVARRSEFDWRGSPDGSGMLISLPFVDAPVRAVCRTEAAVANDLAAAYTKYLVGPVVAVHVVDHSGRAPALVLGAVRTAHRFLLQRPARLNELLALTGGITDRASGDVQIYRTDNSICQPAADAGAEAVLAQDSATPPIRVIKIRDLLAGNPDANPIVRSGDIITVLESEPVYVTGGVNAPQGIGFHDDMTLSRAIALAGGLSENARGGEIHIYRRNPKPGEPGSIDADLNAIKNNKKPDVLLRPFDIVTVPQGGRGAPPRPDPGELLDALTHNEPERTLPLRVID